MKRFSYILLLLSVACTYFKNPSAPQAPTWSPVFDAAAIGGSDLVASRAVGEFYKRNGYQFVWLDSGGIRQAADSMVSIIRSADSYGLLPEDYHVAEINKLMTLPRDAQQAVALELYLTDSFFALCYHLRHGRIERKSLSRRVLSDHLDGADLVALQRVLAGSLLSDVLGSYEPRYPAYHTLKSTLKQMLARRTSDTLWLWQTGQLAVNMERWRWYTPGLPARYISVNVPSFTMQVIDQDSVVVKSKVIIGKPETPTPELESVVRSFIIYPYWHVPRSILKEILPHIQQDTLYLKQHNYDVLDARGRPMKTSSIDWLAHTADDFPYTLRQREGSENTMGIIKFVFNNRYGVYLHDTNARGLFSKTDRALSHGCIRVQKAVELARYLIRNDHIVSPEDLDQYLMLQHRMEIKLIEPIPVYLQYFTCTENDGKVTFHNDLYGKDKAMMIALYGDKKEVRSHPPSL
ncbi:L,D-transpeptidase family protein [Fulvivirgaceae bacterium PWU4]|uniref:L,D-transpeptidase family protein n=1 Tax=Chryseosolibacter histidini TaxID=2782349 RepID=A0AAP2GLB9_9BACT|nr:L,D-transpeptidase family protein [Chryseosolibacter histidini]MBT1700236.1 L,D-transpeptidase family protein [Chryseosolibacter histidini]